MSEATPAEAPAAPATPAPATPEPKAPEKPLSPVERAAKAWDGIRLAAETRAKEAQKTKETKETKTEPPKLAEPTKTDPPAAGAASATPVPKPTEPEEPLSSKFAQVAQLERKARESIKAAKAREEQAQKRIEEVEARLKALEEKRQNPTAWLEEGGLSFEKVQALQANGGRPTPQMVAEAAARKVEALERSQAEAAKKAQEEAQTRAAEAQRAQYAQWQTGVVDFVKANAAKYELIHQQGAHELVPAVIQQRFTETKDSGKPVILKPEEAADLVEKHLEEQAEKLLQTKKLSAKVKPPEPAEPVQPHVPAPTLNNGLTASASSGGKPRTWAERKQAALLAMDKHTKQ